jgi:HPt (histidine-containing phosphotransfer) domain-containing protein
MSDAASIIAARLNELWRTNRPTILERMTVLHSSLKALTQNPADTEARSKGREAAHKLSGVLGVFGLPQGSEIASEIEGILIDNPVEHRPGPPAGQPPTQTALNSEDLATLQSQIAELDAIIASKPAH